MLAISALGAGCGSSDSSSSASPSSSGPTYKRSKAAGTEEQVKTLSAPPGATTVSRKPGPAMTGPVTKTPVVLPLFENFAVPDGPIGDPKKTYTFCFSQAGIHPWATAQKESVMLEAARHPNLKMLYTDPGYDGLAQTRDIQNCRNRHVDAVLMWPGDPASITPVTEKLCKENVVVVGMETSVYSRCATSWVYFDVAAEARLIAEAICKRLSGKGEVAVLLGTLGTSPTILRTDGFGRSMAELCPDVKIVETPPTNYDQATGFSVGMRFLQSPASKNIDMIFVEAMESGLGLLRAEKQTGRMIPMYGIDANRQYITQVRNGDTVLGVVDHTPLHGDLALRLAIQAVEGKKVPKSVLVEPPPLITDENAAAAYDGSWGAK